MTLQTMSVIWANPEMTVLSGTFTYFFLLVCFRIWINNKLGPLKKMRPPLLKKNCLKKLRII